MKNRTSIYGLAIASLVASALLSGCTIEDTDPDVVTTPGSTTVVHDNPAPDVNVVTPPATSSHTETNTTTVESPDGSSSTTSSSTKSGG